jgi:hypothetical protein
MLFVPAFAVWTWKLLEPNPVPEHVRTLLSASDWMLFLAAKGLHLSGYAFLTVLLWLAVRRGWRWAAVAFLLLHGVGTEIGQCFVPNRVGAVRDVAIDWVGVVIGAVVARAVAVRVFTPTRSRPTENSPESTEPA